MRLKIEAINTNRPLIIRQEPNIHSDIIGTLGLGLTTIVNETKALSTGYIWYKVEDCDGWLCHKVPNDNVVYTRTLEQIGVYRQSREVPEQHIENPVIREGRETNINNNDSDDEETSKARTTTAIHDYTVDTSFLGDKVEAVKKNLNILNNVEGSKLSYDLFKNYNRFKVPFTDEVLSKTFSHVFFTRPDLNLIEYKGSDSFVLAPQVENDATFYYLFKTNKNILTTLTQNHSTSHDFNLFLSSMARSFEVSDEYIKTTEHGETFTGYKMQYGKHIIESRTAGTFSVNYEDNKHLEIYKCHKAWIEYISKVYRGEISSKREYITSKTLDYACSVYYIICAADNETILFWTKYYGVFPTNIPSSVTSWGKGDSMNIPEYSISYAYAYKEDFSPLTLAEFNMNSSGDLTYVKSYSEELGHSGQTMTGAPFIETVQHNGHYEFKLRFRA